MPRLSLYRPTKGSDYQFFDRTISEMFTVGGVDINLHKYLGPLDTGNINATEPGGTGLTSIQDMLFLENRDRKYDTSIYTMRTQFRINDSDFDLTQFGLFLTGDTIFATFHLNDMIDTLGRKIMVGDVVEMPFLKDYYPLDDAMSAALKRYYVVQDATRAAEGFSPLWYPHLWRVKLQPLVDSQEYKDIIDQVAGNNTTDTLGQVLSTYNTYLNINDAVVDRAAQDVPESGYDTSTFYTLATDENGPNIATTPTSKITGYLTEDGLPPNGATIAAGIAFPSTPNVGDYYLRLDYVPNRLFRYSGSRWVKIEDAVRTNLTPNPTNATQTQLEGFIQDTNQFLSNAIAWDAIRVTSNVYVPSANSSTISFTLSNTSPYGTVVTNVNYVNTYGVGAQLNGLPITTTIANTSGNLSFTITNTLNSGDLIEYSVYTNVMNERQSLSQALRPMADN